MKKLSILFLAAIIFVLAACEKINGEGDLSTETRSAVNFRASIAAYPAMYFMCRAMSIK